MTRKHVSSTLVLLPLCVLVAAAPALAGGPLFNCQSGVPFVWPNGGQDIVWNPDQGNLGPLTNPQAVALVADSFQVWEDVPSSTISFMQGPHLGMDIDITNFGPIFNPPGPNGLSEIVFDENGEIFDLLFGPGSGVLGFAGPDFGNTLTCEILEGSAFLNGPEFADLTVAKDIMVHEFGHFANTAHTVVNGQAVGFGDTSGPTPDNHFGTPAVTQIETMYPFYFGPGSGTQTLERDDIAIISTLYPEPDFFSTTGTIAGTIFESNGITRVSGVNVIARNLADPFNDAVSAISGDFTDSISQLDPVVGTYTLNGLTPGAQYVVFIDRILAGGFSTTPFAVQEEEYWNNGRESGDGTTDDPLDFEPITVAAGAPVTGIDILFNGAGPGCLDLGDDDFEELPLPFPYTLCDQTFTSVFVNSNGSLTFGVGDTDFSESAAEFLSSPPRIAGLWDDLNPTQGGMICFEQTNSTFTVNYIDVPEFFNTGANTFSIILKKSADQAEISWGDITSTDGIAGVSCGGLNNGLEPETELVTVPNSRTINLHSLTAVYEQFTGDNDLDGYDIKFSNQDKPFQDPFEPNNNLGDATPQELPFNTAGDFTAILPAGDDVDYFEFSAVAGTSVVCEVTSGSLDSVLGIFDADNGNLLDTDDDGGAGLLSRLVFPVAADGNFAIAVSTFPDFDFSGDGSSGGRYVLDCFAINGFLLDLGDDDTEEVDLGFSFPYQGGSFSSVFVNSNGNLTFGGGDTDFSESVSEFLNELPRIAPLWDDLNPSSSGNVIVESDATSWTVTFDEVPEFASSTTNTFSVTLEPDGTITFSYGSVAANDGIVGVTEGGGAADPGETDLSAGGPFSATGTTYEQFTSIDSFDLDGQTIQFVP
jgi:hypothetical protein